MTAKPLTANLHRPAGPPPAFPIFDLAGTVSDARNLFNLIEGALDKIMPLQSHDPERRKDIERATAFLCVARDLAETLEGKLERLDAAPRCEGKGP